MGRTLLAVAVALAMLAATACLVRAAALVLRAYPGY